MPQNFRIIRDGNCVQYDLFVPLTEDKVSYLCFQNMIVYNFPDKLLIESSIVESTLTNIPTAGTSFLSNRAIENGDFIFCFIYYDLIIDYSMWHCPI